MCEYEKQPKTAEDLKEILCQYPSTSVTETRLGDEFYVFQETSEGEKRFSVMLHRDDEASEPQPFISQKVDGIWRYITLRNSGLELEKIEREEALETLAIVQMGLEIMQTYQQLDPEERNSLYGKYNRRVSTATHAGQTYEGREGCIALTLERIGQILETE